MSDMSCDRYTVYVSSSFSTNMLPRDVDNESFLVEFEAATLDEVKALINARKNDVRSIIGHEATAKLFSELLGVELPLNREDVTLGWYNTLVVGSLGKRLEEGRVLTEEEMKEFPITWWVVSLVDPDEMVREYLERCTW